MFDSFPALAAAEAFADAVDERFGKLATVHEDRYDDFGEELPLELEPPIVLVERSVSPDIQQRMIAAVDEFQGRFAGT